jgi:hypothetical protein
MRTSKCSETAETGALLMQSAGFPVCERCGCLLRTCAVE